MKKKLSRLWSLTLVLAVLAGLLVIPVGAAWSLPSYTILSPGELTEIRAGGLARDWTWSCSDETVVEWDSYRWTCTLRGLKPGTATITVKYTMDDGSSSPREVTETCAVAVRDSGAPSASTPAKLEPLISFGTVGEDVSGIIDGAKGFNYGFLPVRYKGLWGLADANMRLVVPFQYEDNTIAEQQTRSNSECAVDDMGHMSVRVDGRDYIIDWRGNVIYAASGSGKIIHADARYGYFQVRRYHDLSHLDKVEKEYYDYSGKEITQTQAEALKQEAEAELAKMDEARGDLYRRSGGYGPPTADEVTFRLDISYYDQKVDMKFQSSYAREGLLVVRLKDGKYGAIDTTGLRGDIDTDTLLAHTVIPFEYDYLHPSREGYVSYQKGSEFGLLENPVNPPAAEAAQPEVPKKDPEIGGTQPEVSKKDPEIEAIPAAGTAYAATETIRVDGDPVEFRVYALEKANGDRTNYVRLRDLAFVLSGTPAQFDVTWNGSIGLKTGTPYTVAGGEMYTPFSGSRSYRGGAQAVQVDSRSVPMTAITLTDDSGGDYSYFKLRDLGLALGFKVDWSKAEGISITTKTASPAAPDTSVTPVVPDTPDTPAAPVVPDTPDTPIVVPDTPSVPSAPDTPVPPAKPSEPAVHAGTLEDPLLCDGKTVMTLQKYISHPVREIKLACTALTTGETANQLALSENMFNKEADQDHEWRFYEFELTHVSSSDSEPLKAGTIIYDLNFYTKDGERIHTEDNAVLGDRYSGYSIWKVNLLPGASGKVVYGILVEKGIGDILLCVSYSDKNQDVWVLLTPCV